VLVYLKINIKKTTPGQYDTRYVTRAFRELVIIWIGSVCALRNAYHFDKKYTLCNHVNFCFVKLLISVSLNC